MRDYALRAPAHPPQPRQRRGEGRRVVFHHLAPMADKLDFTLVFLRERRFLPAPARKRLGAMERRYERFIAKIVRNAVDSGEFRADLDPRMATLALLGLGNSAALWVGREPGMTVERITRDYVDCWCARSATTLRKPCGRAPRARPTDFPTRRRRH